MKIKTFHILLIVFFCWFSSAGFTQNNITEYSNFECSHSKSITVPFIQTNLNNKSPNTINQTVFYEHRDQFSFWYKVSIQTNGNIDCKISPINGKDSYVLYVYKYNKDDFCNKVFYGKIDLLKKSKFLNNTHEKESFELTDVVLKTKKNEVYYFCVLNTSPSNCGHYMQLTSGVDTFNVKAIHLPCTDEDTELKSLATSNKQLNTNSTEDEINITKNYQTVTINVIEENNKTKKVDARLKIKDELTGNEIQIKSTQGSSYTLQIEKGRSYKIEALATGYKKFDHSIIVSEYVHPDSSGFDIFLRPLKTGDNFVMDNIYFYPNTYALKKESEKEITYLLNFLQNNLEIKIELEGHTNGNNKIHKNKAYKDKSPEWSFEGSSKKLSVYRAESIKKFLVKKGISPDRIKTVGYGGDRIDRKSTRLNSSHLDLSRMPSSA